MEMFAGEVWMIGIYGLRGNTDYELRLEKEEGGFISSTGTYPDHDSDDASDSDILWGALFVCVLVIVFTILAMAALQLKVPAKRNSGDVQMDPIPSSASDSRVETAEVPVQGRAGYAQFDIGSD